MAQRNCLRERLKRSPIIPEVRWDLWNLRICILLSFWLQAFLLLFASKRQRYKSIWIQLVIWSAYLLADWIAVYGLGQIVQGPSDRYFDPCESKYRQNLRRELFVFWGQFFLLHLGGSDSITTFSLVDGGSWLKQLAGLFLQFVFTIYSFNLLIVSRIYRLVLPTILVFLAGVIKCGERVKSLLTASFDNFGILLPKPNPGPDYEEALAKHGSTTPLIGAQVVEIPTDEHGSTTPTTSGGQLVQVLTDEPMKMQFNSDNSQTEPGDIRLLREAFSNFNVFKVLFAGSSVSSKERVNSQKHFLRHNCAKAFRSIEFELIFLHDLLHTKAAMTQSKVGIALRLICFSCVLCAFIWFFKLTKYGYARYDVYITYFLLLGTLALDIISVIKQFISHWNFINPAIPWTSNHVPAFTLKRKRWSRSVFRYDMMKYCVNKHQRRVLYSLAGSFCHVERYIDKLATLWFSSLVPITEHLQELIFNELKGKSENASDLKQAKEACSQRGDSAMLRSMNTSPNSEKLKWSIEEFHYMESLLLWHLATTLCCQVDRSPSTKKEICQLLSDYMFYLLVSKPKMLDPDFGNWGIAFQDTQAEIQRFFTKHSISHHMEACEKLMLVQTPCRAAQVKGHESKSLLFDACFLAKELVKIEQQWEVMARVWVELMCFAAINCPPNIHAQQPSRGGELLTHIWLLMNHLGLGTQFSEEDKEHAHTSGVSKGEQT